MYFSDFVESNKMETELAWFGLSDRWKVSNEFKQHIPSQQYGEMTREERENAMKPIAKLCPDPNACKKCRSFKFTQHSSSSSSHTPSTMVPVASSSSIGDLAQLEGQFSKEEISSLSEKAKALIHNKGLREGFQTGSFLVDSGCLTSLQSTVFEEWKVFLFLQFFQS